MYPFGHSCTHGVTQHVPGRLTAVYPRLKLGAARRTPETGKVRVADIHMTDNHSSRRVRHNPEVVASRVGQGGVLVHLQTNRIFELNTTGLRIWELVGEGRALEDVEQVLQREFAGEPAHVRADMLELIEALSGEGLITDDERH